MEINTGDLFGESKGKNLTEAMCRDSLELNEEVVNDSECCCLDNCNCEDCDCEIYEPRILEHDELCDIIDDYEDDFDYQIKNRGKSYYENGNIVSIIRNGNTFISRIDGTKRYEVEVSFDDEDGLLDYDCTCPCDYPCKHEYAVLLAIKNKEYNQTELKPFVKKNEYTIQKLIELIPAEELKKYMLSEEGKDYVCFEIEHFEDYFANYLPSQTYEFYYNNLFNSLVLDGLEDIKYINIARNLINNGEYQEAFDVIKAIIEAANDVKVLNKWNDLIDSFPAIGMILRIIYRKSDNNVRSNIDEWLEILKDNNYYDSLYLEDIVLTM